MQTDNNRKEIKIREKGYVVISLQCFRVQLKMTSTNANRVTGMTSSGNGSPIKAPSKRTDKYSLLLAAVGDKDKAAFEELFKHFAPLIRSFSQASQHEGWFPGLHEDLVQEVMIKIWQKAGKFDPNKASATTWIYTVARNCRIDMLRRKSNTQHLPLENEDYWQETDENTPSTLLQQKRSEDRLHAAMERLPSEQKEILRKVYIEGKSHSETSQELGVPLGTVKSRVRLALQKMQIFVPFDRQDSLAYE